MQDTDAAYVAGLLDGEGSIVLSVRSGREWAKRSDYTLLVRIHNTCKEVLDWTVTVAGGRVYCSSRANRHRPMYQWTIHSVQAAEFLRLMLPYLRIKRDQALLALDFQATKEVVGQPRKYLSGRPYELNARRLAMYQEMIKLHDRCSHVR